ncbi:MAG: hypothetical protein ABEH83_08310 [Halobacterium sp.]
MGVIFVPYLQKAADRVTPDESGEGGLSKRRLAVGALAAGVLAWLAARRLRKEAEAASRQAELEAERPEPTTRLRRVGKGWVRR